MDERAVLSPQVRARLALRSARLGTYVYDPHARTADWDEGLQELFGYAPGEFSGDAQQIGECLHPSDAPALWALVEHSLRRGESFEHEYRITRRDGELRWMHSYGSPVEDDTGGRVLVGVVQDVTDRRLAELEREAARAAEQVARQAASSSQRRLELLARVAALVDAPLDLEATLQQVADLAIGELADWCAVDLESEGGRPRQVAVAHRDPAMVALARELQVRYPPPAGDPVRAQLLATLEPLHIPEVSDEMLVAGAQDAEHLHILRNLGMSSAIAVPLQVAGRGFGVLTLVATHGRLLDAADVDLAVELGRRAGAAVDKTRLYAERERVTSELRRSEARYRTLVETGSLGVWGAQPDGYVTTDLPAVRDITGGSIQGWDWLDDVHPEDRERVRASWLHSVRTGELYQVVYRLRDAAGGWRWMDARGAALREDPADAASAVLEWIGTVADVTAEVTGRTRTEALRDCAEALARALDVEEVLASLEQVAARALRATGVAVALVEGRELVVHQQGYPSLPPVLREALDARETAWPNLRRIVDSREPVFAGRPQIVELLAAVPEVARPQVRAALDSEEVAWAALPLLYGGEMLGAVRFGWSEPQQFDDADRATLAAIAAQHSAALARARLYDAERHTSLTLQAALTPAVPRYLNGVSIGLHYRPAGVGAQVGGDWADALPLPDGRVCLVVGDVMGSGVAAAATMGRLRTALSTLAMHESDPARLLGDLDRLLLSAPGSPLATVALAVVDPATATADLYSAGHLPVLVAPWVGHVDLVEADQVPPIGVGWSELAAVPQPTRVALPPGAVVALCTDGLVETRHDPIDERLALWRSVVDEHLPLGNLDEEAPALVEAMRADPDDDLTLLLARLV